MGQDVRNDSRVCRTPPGPRKDLHWHLKPRTRIMAVGLSFILTTSLIYYLMLPSHLPFPLLPSSQKLTPHGVLTIDGDANFAATAVLEGWLGDGSPQNPFIINGLDIDQSGYGGSCISIINTRFSFTISRCNLTSAEFGIHLENVTNGELVNNTCNSNIMGIFLENSDSNTVSDNICSNNNMFGIFLYAIQGQTMFNTVSNNTCFNNIEHGIAGVSINTIGMSAIFRNNTIFNNTCNLNGKSGIYLDDSEFNIVMNNICNSNSIGISSGGSYNTVANNICNSNSIGISSGGYYNTVANNTCNSNHIGVYLDSSNYNTVSNNTCNSNEFHGIEVYCSNSNNVSDNICNGNKGGIYLYFSNSNTVVNNTCNNNEFHGIYIFASYSNTVANNTCLNNAATTTSTPPPTIPPPLPWEPIAIGGSVALAVIALAVVFFRRR